jgi:hypothetical protein
VGASVLCVGWISMMDKRLCWFASLVIGRSISGI